MIEEISWRYKEIKEYKESITLLELAEKQLREELAEKERRS